MSTDGIIFSVLIADKGSKDTAYIFPESKNPAGTRLSNGPRGRSLNMYSAKRQASKSCSVTLHLTIRKQMNSAMSYEQIAILGIIICVLVIVAELLWLFS